MAQMGARMPPPDYDSGTWRNASDGWMALVLALVQFGGPFIIARNAEGDGGGILYWKWWFITVLITVLMLSFTKSLGVGLITAVAVIAYGILKNSTKP